MNLLQSMASDGTKSPGHFLGEPMTSVQNATRMPSIHPSVGATFVSLLACGPIVLVGRDPWTAEEDELLWSAFEKHGNKWHTIANNLQGRPGQSILVTHQGTAPLMGYVAIHCRNRLQSLQRARAVVEDAVSPPANEPLSAPESSPSPSLSSFSIPSPPRSSSPLTLSLLTGEGPSQVSSSTAPTIPGHDTEPECQFNHGFPPESHPNESFQISPQILQHGFPIAISAPTDDPAGCWQGVIPPSELWKGPSPENSIVGEDVQFYQPPQALTMHVDPAPHTFNNSSSNTPIIFTMTCPVPHCCYQCQTVVEIWRHFTWTHVHPQPDDGIEGIVEKVVLGNV